MANTLDTFTEATVIGDTDLLHLKVGTSTDSDKKITGANAKTAFSTAGNLSGHITSTGLVTILGAFTVAQLSTALSDATLSGNNTGD